MYPYLNAGGVAYPRGDNFPDIDGPLKLRGFAYCDVLPDFDAPIGYLPQRFNSKLMFTLCRTCAEEKNVQSECTHNNVPERYLTGVWFTDELNKAICRGYQVLKYHEIMYWENESSGWPR
uniref:DNA-directed DNA polymerase n=1 Tax=Caenorhabditis tropicalis TaxID=1561998 RepID=A0A1I7U2S8_9PELO